MDFLAAILAVSSSFLVASKSPHIRLLAFSGFFLANCLWIIWVLFVSEIVLLSVIIQSSFFIISALLGFINNRKLIKEKASS